ncbi:MACPF domain-containing protein At4g24290-like [Macadamia integrifolia]|uniref:MACPF domain-containing protein At4g24290-like n=1 Tax=Macadamia integrifolia TaxID=60698 RepID=UPI001C501516|nr:MACPF domain-containing protein At4g24290-like [Macadamia integrifolia]
MSELLNQKSSIQGKVPSGYFNSIFELSGAWLHDATDTKYLAFDGYFVSLYYLHLTASPLLLQEKVKKAVPSIWDPASLSRFIQTYGTHIIVGMGVGGQDLVCVRQKPFSSVPPADLKGYLEDLGDRLFSDGRRSLPLWKTRDSKQKVPEVFYRILHSNTMPLTSISESSSKDGLTIISSKRGGNAFLHSHHDWLQSVPSNPDVILFKFVPITSLLTGIPGSGYLSHAINLYLRYKPTPDDLRYFLEFQVPLQYAPMFSELPLGHQRRKVSGPALQFRIMGPKLRVSSAQVSTDRKPVTGLRLYLEGEKCNRIALHLQHLSSVPNIIESLWAASSTSRPSEWRGSDDYEIGSQYLEPVKWRRYSNICTLAVEHDPKWLQGENDGVFVVTGGQLVTRGKWPRTVLHLRLLFTHLPNCSIRSTEWATVPAVSQKSGFLANLSTTFLQREVAGRPKQVPAALNSGVYPDGPPLPTNARRLLRYIETGEVVRGPHDNPGHWLVTAAKLAIEGHKIALQTKFALLNYPS